MEFLLIACGLGVVTAVVAANKGRNAFGWFIFGTLMAIVALPMVLILPANQKQVERKAISSAQSRKCPSAPS